jgi:polyhydroxyalkanoate synthesis regulator phasin
MLQTGNPQHIAQVTFWVTLKFLEVMSRIRKYNFKDDPVVSSELVKFLTVNTGFEVVEQLSVKMKTLEESNKELSIKGTSKLKTSTNAAAAKVAELTKSIALLEKRVKDLEKKREGSQGDFSDGLPNSHPTKYKYLSPNHPEANVAPQAALEIRSKPFGIKAKPPTQVIAFGTHIDNTHVTDRERFKVEMGFLRNPMIKSFTLYFEDPPSGCCLWICPLSQRFTYVATNQVANWSIT